MKKIATLLALVMVFTATTFATTTPNNINENVTVNFRQRFAQAKEVNWSKSDNYLKASFVMNGQRLAAYYAETGELMGVSRNIVTSQLPINLQSGIAKNLETGWVSELFEFATDNDTAYYITIENADQQVTLKSTGNYSWSVFKKVKKS